LLIRKKLFKLYVDINLLPLTKGLNSIARPCEIICSLTSHGRRVGMVHYTVVSLLRQKCKPDRIILWLDQDNWNEANLPFTLRRLFKYGLTVKLCKDLRVHTKLLYAIKNYPESIVVTADDDMYYPSDWLDGLYEAHQVKPRYILCYWGTRLRLSESNNILPMNQWEIDTREEMPSHAIMPLGVYGILYPPMALHNDVHEWKMIQKIALSNDDIWFWTMSVRNNTLKAIVRRAGLFGRRIRPYIYELYDTHCDKLANMNVIKGRNDIIMQAVERQFSIAAILHKEKQ
jgi:hypothetical protein